MVARLLLIGFLLSLSSAGCDFVYHLLHPEGAEEKKILGEAIPYKSNNKVAEVQKLLKLYGYNPGGVDGALGYNTRQAIEAFQKDNNLKVTQYVDRTTWQRLHPFDDRGLVVRGEVNIAMVQTALKNAGFNPGGIDGKEGPMTRDALKKFQQAMGLKPDGRVGFQTLRELYDFLPPPSDEKQRSKK